MDKKRVLVIEDQEDVRENIVELLELSNYQVDSAANGKEGTKWPSTPLLTLFFVTS